MRTSSQESKHTIPGLQVFPSPRYANVRQTDSTFSTYCYDKSFTVINKSNENTWTWIMIVYTSIHYRENTWSSSEEKNLFKALASGLAWTCLFFCSPVSCFSFHYIVNINKEAWAISPVSSAPWGIINSSCVTQKFWSQLRACINISE